MLIKSKVGDRVKRINNSNFSSEAGKFNVGDTGIIVNIRSDKYCDVKMDKNNLVMNNNSPEFLELLKSITLREVLE